MRMQRDSVKDFISLRRNLFGFELAPLPASLQLSLAESSLGPAAHQSAAAFANVTGN